MGKERTTQTTTQTVTPEPLPEQKELIALDLEARKAAQPGMIEAQTSGLSLINRLLTGQSLPGALDPLAEGFSEDVIQELTSEAISDIEPRFQARGILDSGVLAETAGRISGDIRRASYETDLNRYLNLLNLAVGGQAQIQSPILTQAGQLSQRLAGLTPVTTTGSAQGMTSTNFWASPFGAGFGQGFGSAVGTGLMGGGG